MRSAVQRAAWSAVYAWGIVVVLTLMTGCDSTTPAIKAADVPVVAGAMRPPGTKLPDGFRVPRGALLIGAAVPQRRSLTLSGNPFELRGWSAALLVTGEPKRVLRSLADHGAQLGLGVSVQCPHPDVDGFLCSASGDNSGFLRDAANAARLDLTLERHRGGRGLPPASHLLITFRAAPGRTAGRSGLVSRGAEGDAATPAIPTEWPPLLGPGDRIPTSVTISREPLRVPAGTKLIAPLAPFSECITGGFAAMFAVTRSAESLVDDYARQFEASGFEGSTTVWRDGEATITEALYFTSGGGVIEARVVERPRSRSFLQLLRCND